MAYPRGFTPQPVCSWRTIEVTQRMDSGAMSFLIIGTAQVFAKSEADAMKALRREFRTAHFRVVK